MVHPRDDKQRHTKFPSVGGVPRSGGVVREAKTVPHLCHCERNVAISFLLLCRSGAYAPCAYPRICSNCASACFHILGFIASHRRWRGNPVNKTCRVATQYLNFSLWTLHFEKTPHWAFFNSLHWQPIFYDPLHDGGLIHRVRPWSPFFHGTRAYARGVFLMVDMFFLLP